MFSNLNFWEIGTLLLLALFIFGPERLPKVISDGVRMVRNLRDMARNATTDLSRELGTEVRLEDLNPKAFIRKHLLTEEDEATLRRPFEDAFRDVKQITTDAADYGTRVTDLTSASAPQAEVARAEVARTEVARTDVARTDVPQPPRSTDSRVSDGHGYDQPGPYDTQYQPDPQYQADQIEPRRYQEPRPYDGPRTYDGPARYDSDAT